MKLRSRIFLVSFSVSVALLGGAAIALTVFAPRDEEATLAALQESVDELSAAVRAVYEKSSVEADTMNAALGPIRRDVARRAVLERDVAIATAAGWSVFLAAEALAAVAVSAAAARALTARWSRLRDGILRVRHGGPSEPFFAGTRDEFGAVEEALDSLVEALGDRERMRSELRALQGWGEASAFLAHQARTPLASLTLSAKAAHASLDSGLAGTGLEKAAAEAMSAISRAEADAARIATLFSRVRSLSGFKDPELEDMDPEEALREACATLGARGLGLDASDVIVERRGSDRRPRFDRGYLVEAFLNLLSNSLEACAERGPGFRAVVTLSSNPDSYLITYADSVTGLDPALVGRVGSTRFSTKPDGAGLGVWLVGRIAALHGGRLDTGMSEAHGLTFTMTFPLEGGE